MSRPERPVPPPFEGNDRLITTVITAGWAVALVVLIIIRDQLPAADRWWIWVAAFGTFMGVFGMVYVPYLKRSRSRAAARRQAARAKPELTHADGTQHVSQAEGEKAPADRD